MSFEIPKHAIAAFLDLGRSMENKDIILWAQYMKSFTTPGYIRNGEQLFISHEQVCAHASMYEHVPQESVQLELAKMLRELFIKELIIPVDVAQQLVVELDPKSNMYLLRHESIGRYREWCWIDQKNTDRFVQIGEGKTELSIMRAIAERHENPHRTWSGIVN